jgi:cytochrome c551/c552/cytochrome c553
VKRLAAVALLCAALQASAQDRPWHAIGRPATPAEVKAWDTDVRPDFKGLPKGRGSVAQGEHVFETRCASCHGSFGESNEVFAPLAGGTTADDIKTGRVAALAKGGFPQRTTMMKLSHVSTLWDYINRAMPWNAPKSLTTDQVYAVSAYILNLGGVVEADFTLSNDNIATIDAKLPNRHGLQAMPGLWQTHGKADTANVACMKDCALDVKVTSFLPEFARNAHGNLASQNRLVGPVRGVDTARQAPQQALAQVVLGPQQRLEKNGCTACHAIERKIVGPALREVATRRHAMPDAVAYLAGKIRLGGSGEWGAMAMPPQTLASEADVIAIAQWLADGAK